MAPAASPTGIGDLFRQAVETFETALKTGVSMQEETARRFTEMLRDFGSPMEWQHKGQSVINETIVMTQKNVEESMRAMNQNAKAAMSLMQKTFEAHPLGNGGTADKSQPAAAKPDDLWEAALGALRTNTQVALQANTRMMESWAQLAKDISGRMQRTAEEAMQHAEETMQKAGEQVRQAQPT
jgi:ElaB/YqjD/DUF883 family membrane-anchored ribosome-binding protein